MPLEPKPLFWPDVSRKHLKYFNLSEAVKKLRSDLAKWAGLIESNKINALEEPEILPDFLTIFFGKLPQLRRAGELPGPKRPFAPALARVMETWPTLPEAKRHSLARWPEIPEAIRDGILALFGATRK